MVFDGFSSCMGGLGTGCNRKTYPAVQFAATNDGYLNFSPADASSATAVVDELDLLLTAGRLDDHARQVITDEFERVHNLSACPVDRSVELCGRLTPGDELAPGEQITNSHGEVLCLTYDGSSRHIGADGREVFSTAPRTRVGR